ncbi:prepilin peptidase [Neokomagataea thailandica]|uniref:prepilin peptidase n=1 Tax=Neokomagataea TaxID=1223423 RepID=UPI00082FA352|nr:MULTISPECIES: A24 family peptidase [Neokomagataea]
MSITFVPAHWPLMATSLETLFPVLLISPIIGSFLGVLIRRIPSKRPFLAGRSHCEVCQSPLRPWEMVPILSYLRQRGRCQHCQHPIAPFHFYIELIACCVPLSAWIIALYTTPQLPNSLDLLWTCSLGWGLLALSWIDLRCFRLPDSLTLPLILAGLLNAIWRDALLSGGLFYLGNTLIEHLEGCLLGWFFFTSISWLYLTTKGRPGLGAGDAKLLAAGGAWLGVSALPHTIVYAALFGIAHIVTRRFLKHDTQTWQEAIPFGPSLALSIWFIRLISDQTL